jgi:phosphoglycerate dehydrogenase-like enzyme
VVDALEWRHLLPKTDYVVIATPLTPETEGLIDEAALRLLSPHAYLINIARGAIIDENALVKALRERWFAGAALEYINFSHHLLTNAKTNMEEALKIASVYWSK